MQLLCGYITNSFPRLWTPMDLYWLNKSPLSSAAEHGC